MESAVKLSGWNKWKEVLRIAYTLPFVLSSIVGVVFALTLKQEWPIAILIPLDVFVLALFVNFSNDYYDHKSGVDKLRFSYDEDPQLRARIAELFNQKVFWSGNSLDRGIISDRQGKVLMALLGLFAIIISIPIILYGGLLVIILGLISLALAYFYTAPPLNLGARGLGEVDVFLSFTMMSFFSYYVIVQQFNWTMLFLSLTVGVTVMLMRISDEAPGNPAHLKMGERNLLVVIGMGNIKKLEIALVVLYYAFVTSAAITDPWFVLLFLTLPISVGAIRLLDQKDDLQYWRPIPQFLKLAVSNELLIVIVLIARTLTS
jgi:1,4-dihydroxy-2-naphthoate octaprenyltransferase